MGKSEPLGHRRKHDRHQPSSSIYTLYSIGIWHARYSRLTHRQTLTTYIVRCASVLAWSYVAGHLPEQLVIDLL